MGSRNTSVRTGRQKVSQVTDNTRPAGLSTLVPVRVFRDFSAKTPSTFRTNPTAAAVIRTRNHNGTNQFGELSWHQAFGLEEYGHGNYITPAYDTGSGEFTSGQYSNIGTVGGGFATADARLINDVAVTGAHTGMIVLDVKQSRDGRYTYVLSAGEDSGNLGSVFFNVFDNLSGTQLAPTLASASNPSGILQNAAWPGIAVLGTAHGNIAVVDDTTGHNAGDHMDYNSAVIAFEVVANNSGTPSSWVGVFRYDFAANNVDALDGTYALAPATPGASTNPAWAEVQLVTQAAGTMKAIVAYRFGFLSALSATFQFALFTSFAAGANVASGPIAISGAANFDMTGAPTTAVSFRGPPSTNRRLYLYFYVTGASSTFNWYVINPATFFGGGVADQNISQTLPTTTTYMTAKAHSMPPAFIDGGGHPHMFVAFIYKNSTANITNVQCFMHTTVTAGSDTFTSSMSANPPGVTIATASGNQPIFTLGNTVASDPGGSGGALSAASVVYLHPSANTYTLTEILFTDPTDMTKIFPQAVITAAGATNTALNTLPASNLGGFGYGSANWDFNPTQNQNDIQSLAFVNAAATQVFLRVTTPFAAIALLWDADVYENLPNPTDANTNGRTTTFFARATGANFVAYTPGVRVYTWGSGGFTSTLGSNAVDITGGFVTGAASTTNPTTASQETNPAFVHADGSATITFVATMADEFTFNISSWSGLPIYSNQIQAGMTIQFQDPFVSLTSLSRHTITNVAYDDVNRTITQIQVAQPVHFHAQSTTYVVSVSVGPSTAVRQLVTTSGDGEINNRTGNVVFPMIVQVDYISIETLATNSEIAEMVVPLDSGLPGAVPTGAQVTLRGYNMNNTTIPTDIVDGIVVGVSLDGGSTWNTKSLRINSTLIHGQTLANSFGVQTFAGASDSSVPWVTVPAGIAVGDYFFVGAGPNAGRYVITGLTNDTNVNGPRIYLDRPFPVPGSTSIEPWYCTNAKDDYEGDGTIPNLGFGSFGMNFDLTGMTVSGGNLHVRIEFKDGVTGHDVTYEIDSFSVQWSP